VQIKSHHRTNLAAKQVGLKAVIKEKQAELSQASKQTDKFAVY
jgi:hypothetical protein